MACPPWIILLAVWALGVPLVSGPFFLPAGPSRGLALSFSPAESTRPLRIGVLAHELTNNMKQNLAELLGNSIPKDQLAEKLHAASQISSNYIKFIALGEVEFYPVLVSDPLPLIIRQMRYLDGMLLPGGAPGFQFLEPDPKSRARVHVRMNLRRRYFRKADQIIESAKYINKHIRPFALFGICLGFEMMLLNESRFRLPLEHVHHQNVNAPVSLLSGTSRFQTWLEQTHPDYQDTMANGPQFFYNSKGVSVAAFENNRRVSRNYQVLSHFESAGKRYVAAVEHRTLPFFGIQFHPEKNMFDFSDYFKADHSPASVKASRLYQEYFRYMLGKPQPDLGFDPTAFPGPSATVLPSLGFYKDLWVYSREPALQNVLGGAIRRQVGFMGSQ